MNIIKIVSKNTFTCTTISALIFFVNFDYSLLSQNRLVPVQLFLDNLKKVSWISAPPFTILLKKELKNSLN